MTVTVVGWLLKIIGMVGAPTLLMLWLGFRAFRSLRLGRKARGAAAFTRDVTISAVAAAGVARLVLGPRWRRWVVTLSVAAGWLVTWRVMPQLRWLLAAVIVLSAGAAVWAAAWYYAWRFGLWQLRVDHVLIEGYRLAAEATAASRAVKDAVGSKEQRDVPTVRARGTAQDGCSTLKLEPPPGRTLDQLRHAVAAGALDSSLVASLRSDGVVGADEPVTLREIEVEDGCVWVKVMYGMPVEPDDGLDDTVSLSDLEAFR